MFWTHLVAEAGLLGTLAYLWIIGACFMVGRRAYRAAVTPRRKALLLGLLYAIPGTVLVSLLSTTLENNPTATLFWTLGGLTVLAAAPDAPSLKMEVMRG
jgi:O-antigen ligase